MSKKLKKLTFEGLKQFLKITDISEKYTEKHCFDEQGIN